MFVYKNDKLGGCYHSKSIFYARRSLIFLWSTLLLLACFNFACELAPEPKDAEEEKDLVAQKNEDLENQLKEDPDVLGLLAVRDKISQQILDSGVSGQDLQQVFYSNDPAEITQLLGFTQAEVNYLNNKLIQHSNALLARYSELQTYTQTHNANCSDYSCFENNEHANALFTNLDTYLSLSTENGLGKNQAAVACEWLPFIGALILCAQTGPILYWICAYVSLCSFCDGGWVDAICF